MRLAFKFALTLAIAGLFACETVDLYPVESGPVPPADWFRVATVAGAAVDRGDGDVEWITLLNRLVHENVTVVEADSSLSEYQDTESFEKELVSMTKFSTMAHERNLKVVWYYPSLEVITQDGEGKTSGTMYTDHPDWVQYGVSETPANGQIYEPNVFYGSLVFWVDPGAESAWMDPHTAYRDFYLDRVRKIAASGIDGLWLDVPLYNDIVGRWASHSEASRAAFKADTGFSAPVPDYEGQMDPDADNFRVWLAWRHWVIADFLRDVQEAARGENPAFHLVVETVTMDYNAALLEGLDGSYPIVDADDSAWDQVYHVWEVDALSDTSAMFHATEDDWASLIAMYEYGRGQDRNRAGWAFTYGYQPDDAEAVLFTAVTAQINPYELKVPEMTTTVGNDYRERVFGWLRDNESDVYRSQSSARVAIVHSSPSRDYTDVRCLLEADEYACGVSLFPSWSSPSEDIAWWTTDIDDSLYSSDYMAEYRGIVQAMVSMHEPFDIISLEQLTAIETRFPGNLDQYDLLVIPAPTAISDTAVSFLNDWVTSRGKHLLLTGLTPGALDERGLERATNALADLAPLEPSAPDTCRSRVHNSGSVWFCESTLGKAYLAGDMGDVPDDITQIVYSTRERPQPVVTDAAPTVYVDVYARPSANRTLVHALNFTGADGAFDVKPQVFMVGVYVGTYASASVTATSAHALDTPNRPMLDSIPGLTDGQCSPAGGYVCYEAQVGIHTMFMISLTN